MESEKNQNEIIERLKDRPELIEQIGKLFEIEDDVNETDLLKIETQTIELIKSIGADSLEKTIESKEENALKMAKQKNRGRVHGKKN